MATAFGVVVAVTPARAYVPPPVPVVLPGAALGTGAVATGAGAASVSGALVAGAFLTGYYGSTAALNLLFGDDPVRLTGPGTTCPAGTYMDGYTYQRAGDWPGGTLPHPARPTADGPNYIQHAYVVRAPGAEPCANANTSLQWAYAPKVGALGGTPGESPGELYVMQYGTGTMPSLPAIQPWTVETTTICRNNAGIEVAHTMGHTVTPVANGTVNVPTVNCSTILPDSHVEGITATGGLTGGGSGTLVEVDAWTPEARADYPACTAGTGGTPACQLVLRKDGASCFDGTDCTSWPTVKSPSYGCTWGPYTVPLAWCEDAYPDGWTTTTDPGPTPTPTAPPTTGATPPPVTGAPGTGTTITLNPDGSRTETQTTTLPDGNTRTVTTTTQPDGSTSITTTIRNPAGEAVGAPVTVTVPAPRNPTDPGTNPSSDGEGCMGEGFTWNPVSWVYTPVKCALAWAFVPPPNTPANAFGQVGDAWDGSALGVTGAMWGDFWAPIDALDDGPAADCLGPLVTIPIPTGEDLSLRPLNVCSPLAQQVLALWMPIASAGIYTGAFFGIYRSVGRSLGVATPVVRAS